MDKFITQRKKKHRTRNILVAATLIIVGGLLVRKVLNGLKIDELIADDSYDYMMY